jgi:D-arabinose 1-dehydrogenase-like Zn-dependent alcohol dehydrogenase
MAGGPNDCPLPSSSAIENKHFRNAFMKAFSDQGIHKVSVSESSQPKLNKPTDALLQVTTSGICGSVLHMYDGRTPLKPGTVCGHEIVRVIDEVRRGKPNTQQGLIGAGGWEETARKATVELPKFIKMV